MGIYEIAKATLDEAASWTNKVFFPVMDARPYGSLVSNGTSVPNVTITGANQITWPCDGYLVAIRANTRDGATASACGMLLRVVVDGTDELFPLGTGTGGGGYLSFYAMCGDGLRNQRYFIRRPFKQASTWQFYLNNTTATNPLVADLAFDYLPTRK